MGGLKTLYKDLAENKNSSRMPVLFVGHGSPMNALEDNLYSKTWKELGSALPEPAAILSVSAHWLTHGKVKLTSMPFPKTIHDFGGFPRELFEVDYPAPGTPDLARQTIDLLRASHAEEDQNWGLDHGTWSVLVNMYSKANIPVYQLSIDYTKPPEYHYNIMKELKVLRNKGVLLMGSGNIVHNLSMLRLSGKPFDWSVEFDTTIKKFIDKGDYQSVVDFQKLGSLAKISHPSYDHFLPLLYSLGMADEKDTINYFNEGFDLGSISMRSILLTERR